MRLFTHLKLTIRKWNPPRALSFWGCFLMLLALGLFGMRTTHSDTRAIAATHTVAPAPISCERGISAAKREVFRATADTVPHLNNSSVGEAPPRGMARIRGGEFWMGSDDPMFNDARPWHRVYLTAYFIDKTLVTNEQFGQFVKATHYVTVAERAPRAEDFPGAPAENLVAGSVVFSPPDHPVSLNNHYQWWNYVKGANWRHPQGPDSGLKGKQTHPVVQIAYPDAEAYCEWAGKRLPTEAEFEFAQRGGLDRKPYAWGDQFRPDGKFMANTFQGHFPDKSIPEDGYGTTSPVGAFPANGYGLTDMSGNVWEWTSDWYRPDYYQTLAASGQITRDPKGPKDSVDPSEPGTVKKVQRGGSFLCTEQYCSRYKVGARGKGEPDTGTNHVGFRCVMPAVSGQPKAANNKIGQPPGT